MKISENKLEPLEREKIQGYVVMVVIAENPNSKERFIWTTPEIIRQCESKWEFAGVLYKKWMWVYYVEPEKWNVGLQSFVEELQRITGQH